MTFHDLDVKRGVADQGDVKRLLLAMNHLDGPFTDKFVLKTILKRLKLSSDNRKLTIRDHRILTTLRRVCCSGRSEGDRPASANW